MCNTNCSNGWNYKYTTSVSLILQEADTVKVHIQLSTALLQIMDRESYNGLIYVCWLKTTATLVRIECGMKLWLTTRPYPVFLQYILATLLAVWPVTTLLQPQRLYVCMVLHQTWLWKSTNQNQLQYHQHKGRPSTSSLCLSMKI